MTEVGEALIVAAGLLEAAAAKSPVPMLIVQAESEPSSVIWANEAAAEAHGSKSPASLIGLRLKDIMGSDQEVASALAIVRGGGATKSLWHKRLDRTQFRADATFTDLVPGRSLFLVCQTFNGEWYRAIFDRLPNGIVVLDPTDRVGNWPIIDCNPFFEGMNGYGEHELIGAEIRKVSSETALDGRGERYREQYYDKLSGEEPYRFEEKHRRKDGTDIWVQVSSWLVKLHGETRVLGVDRDITDEREYLEDLRRDIGRTLHSFASTMIRVDQALTVLDEGLGIEEEVSTGVGEDTIWDLILAPRNRLVAAIDRFSKAATVSDFHRQVLSPDDWENLTRARGFLLRLEHDPYPRLSVPTARRAARLVLAIMERAASGHLANEFRREVRKAAEHLDKLTCRISISQLHHDIVDIDFLANDVGQRLTGEELDRPDKQTLVFWDLVVEAASALAEYADGKHVEFVLQDDTAGATVVAVRSDVVRILSNLLNNAIKYSWSRPTTSHPWISVWGQPDGIHVRVDIEDYGVPIPQSEIEKGLIFKMGYRGRLATQWARPGTGIGLHDSKETAKALGGDVTVQSRPARPDADPSDPKAAHIKTVTLRLPIARG